MTENSDGLAGDAGDGGDVVVDVDVEAPIGRAFAVFTEQMNLIKPREHNLLDVPIEKTVLEPTPGGDVYDLGVDGSVCRWGRVLEIERPTRLLLGWLIGPRWVVESEPDRMSEVEVLFEELGPGRTRVRLTHRHLDRHGTPTDGQAAALGSEDGWPLYLRRFVELAGA